MTSLFVADTGSGNRMGNDNLSGKERKTVHPAGEQFLLSTANDNIVVDKAITIDGIDLLVLDKCPPVLSVGKLVEDLGWSFHWPIQDPAACH